MGLVAMKHSETIFMKKVCWILIPACRHIPPAARHQISFFPCTLHSAVVGLMEKCFILVPAARHKISFFPWTLHTAVVGLIHKCVILVPAARHQFSFFPSTLHIPQMGLITFCAAIWVLICFLLVPACCPQLSLLTIHSAVVCLIQKCFNCIPACNLMKTALWISSGLLNIHGLLLNHFHQDLLIISQAWTLIHHDTEGAQCL